ncbi:hypothetical protein GCM10010112_03570 [Actinoplanes lobatus]|nr:hypothetical protein GCM10010112_03570 [Actinoplanes lobatus]
MENGRFREYASATTPSTYPPAPIASPVDFVTLAGTLRLSYWISGVYCGSPWHASIRDPLRADYSHLARRLTSRRRADLPHPRGVFLLLLWVTDRKDIP